MILYDYFRSSAAYRLRIALNLKGLVAERRFVHLRKGEQRDPAYLGVNPQGLVPTLLDGGVTLTQSLAQAIACDIHPIDNTRVLQYLEQALGLDEAKRNEWYAHWIRLGFEAIEKRLAERSGKFAFGDAPGLADLCIVPQVANAGRVKLAMDPYPRLRAIHAACLAHPAFDAAQPSKQPDAE